MSYETGRGGLDYFPCSYENSKIMFRGPEKALNHPYIAFLGGTDTYGRFIPTPFPELVGQKIGVACVNLGSPNAGIDVFALDPYVPGIAANAQITVIQVMSVQNMSNRLYSVHRRRNDRFISPSKLMKSIYSDVDFAEFHFNRHMLTHLHTLSSERFNIVIEELRTAWLARMRLFLSQIPGKKLILWMSERRPEDQHDTLSADPWILGRYELNALRNDVDEIVEVIASQDALACGTEGMVFSELERPMARKILNPAVHQQTADALIPILSKMLY